MQFPNIAITAISGIAFSATHANNAQTDFGLFWTPAENFAAQEEVKAAKSLSSSTFGPTRNDGSKVARASEDASPDLHKKNFGDTTSIGQEEKSHRALQTFLYEWTQLGQDIDGEANGDRSGQSVSLSSDGMTVAIGAPLNSGTAYEAGHVRVYQWNGYNSWVQFGQDIDGEAGDDYSGSSVSLSSDGKIVAIGAPFNKGTAPYAGHVRVYQWNESNSWIQLGQDIDGEAAYDRSGVSVSLSSNGMFVAIGADFNNGTAPYAGHVRVYQWNGYNSWIQLGQDIDGEANDDRSGVSVSLSSDGKIVAIGAYFNGGTAPGAGHVRVYQRNESNSWIQLGQDIDGEAANDWSGWSVSLSSDSMTVAIGAPLNSDTATYAGHVRVYQWNESNSWIQLGQDIDGEVANDLSGYSVSLSSDGKIVAIGALYNDGTAPDAGHVRVYQWNGSSNSWIQLGQGIDGEAGGDYSGSSVSVSSNGRVVVIGANGSAGYVRVYTLPSSPSKSPTASPTNSPTKVPTQSSTMSPSQTPSTLLTLSKALKSSKSKSEKVK